MKKEIEDYVTAELATELKEIENSGRGTCSLPLSKYERAIIYKYSSDGYESLNEILRNGNQMPSFGKFLNDCLIKLPNYEGICYRSIKTTKSSLDKYYKALEANTFIVEKGFLSCSRSKLLALYFSNSPLFIIKSKYGKDIEKIAKFGVYGIPGQNEKEVLFRNDSKFKVLDISEEKDRITILLEEIQ